jgi:hypothetical protein
MKVLYLILTTKHQPERDYNQLNTWLKGQEYLYLTDEEGDYKLKCTDNDTYASNEEKQIFGINYVIKNYKHLQYDWFCFCDNDTFIFTENLKKKLRIVDPNRVWGYVLNKKSDPLNPVYTAMGQDFEYCSGGAGYCISRNLITSLPEIPLERTGYGDVTFGSVMRRLKIKFDHLEGIHPHNYTVYNDEYNEPVSYHYVKTLKDFAYLYSLNGSNIISISLWGNKEKYRYGALKNIELAKSVYPGWKLRFYIDKTIDMEFAKKLHGLGCQVYQTPGGLGSFEGMYWRFWVNDDLSVKRFCIRDADSRFNRKEAVAVTDWIDSKQPFHIMRDHKNHVFPIQGGLWGGTPGYINNIRGMIANWNQYDKYSCDQFFLADRVYPLIKNAAQVHCTYIEKKPFPPHVALPDGEFVGQVFDEFDKGYPE